MKLIPLKSSTLAAVHYDDNTESLTVHFNSGAKHSYAGVPHHHYAELINAKSPGSYFHTHIRNTYASW